MILLDADTVPVPFTGEGGWTGMLHPAPQGSDEAGMLPRLTVRPDDGGTSLLIPAEIVTRQENGTYFVPLSRTDAEAAYALHDSTVIPLLEETVSVSKRMVETGKVRITKTVRETQEIVDEPLLRRSGQRGTGSH